MGELALAFPERIKHARTIDKWVMEKKARGMGQPSLL